MFVKVNTPNSNMHEQQDPFLTAGMENSSPLVGFEPTTSLVQNSGGGVGGWGQIHTAKFPSTSLVLQDGEIRISVNKN